MSQADKLKRFRERLRNKETLVMPGAFNAAVALLIQQHGFDGCYISGAGLVNGVVGMPDVGMLTMTEVATQAGYIADAVDLPCIVDADTGFGETVNVIRTVQAFEKAGMCGLHLEDQVMPKRCGHLVGKQLVSTEAMVEKIAAAVSARKNPDFLLIARTDARGVTGFEDAVQRAKAYVAAGADMIFPEALKTEDEFAEFARRVPVPLLANMTEFGQSPLLTVDRLAALGYGIVIFPMTLFRVMMGGVHRALETLKQEGSQQSFVATMQTRQELYDLLGYAHLV